MADFLNLNRVQKRKILEAMMLFIQSSSHIAVSNEAKDYCFNSCNQDRFQSQQLKRKIVVFIYLVVMEKIIFV